MNIKEAFFKYAVSATMLQRALTNAKNRYPNGQFVDILKRKMNDAALDMSPLSDVTKTRVIPNDAVARWSMYNKFLNQANRTAQPTLNFPKPVQRQIHQANPQAMKINDLISMMNGYAYN